MLAIFGLIAAIGHAGTAYTSGPQSPLRTDPVTSDVVLTVVSTAHGQ
jgi:hypothetical protein